MTQQPPSIASAPGDAIAAPTATITPVLTAIPSEEKPKKDKKDKKKKERNRGIETMFRVTYQNHVSLSKLADNKAHVLITLNGAIISFLIAILTPRFNTLSWTFVPALLLTAGCTVSFTFGVLALRPRLSRTPLSLDQVRNNQGNALFFGQFTSMSLADFHTAIHVLMKDDNLIYDGLARQLYSMGLALLRKYHHLQIAYTVFLCSIAAAAALFGALLLTFGLAR